MKIAFCRGCQGRMVWGLSPAGKKMPVDSPAVVLETVVPRIPVYQIRLDGDDVQFVKVDRERADPGTRVYTPHFATCPNREQFTKAGRR
jgi:hypothetical protein